MCLGAGGTKRVTQHSREACPGIHRHPLPPKRLTAEQGLRAGSWDNARKSKGSGAEEPHAAESAVRTRQEKQ